MFLATVIVTVVVAVAVVVFVVVVVVTVVVVTPSVHLLVCPTVVQLKFEPKRLYIV